MAINYEPIGWNTTKYVNPSNMNHMDDGIKAACDGVDAVNENLGTKNLKTYTDITQFGLESADTIEAIITALPSYSELIYGVSSGSALATSLPLNGDTGELRVTKTTSYNGGRGRIECKNYRSKAVHINYYYNGTLGAWDSNALNSDLPITKDITTQIADVGTWGTSGNIYYGSVSLPSGITADKIMAITPLAWSGHGGYIHNIGIENGKILFTSMSQPTGGWISYRILYKS